MIKKIVENIRNNKVDNKVDNMKEYIGLKFELYEYNKI